MITYRRVVVAVATAMLVFFAGALAGRQTRPDGGATTQVFEDLP